MAVFHTYGQGSTNALHTPDGPFLQLFLHSHGLTIGILLVAFGHDFGALGPRKKVHDIDDAFLVNVSGL